MRYKLDNLELISNFLEEEIMSGSVLRAYRICVAQKMKNADVYLKDHLSQHKHGRKQEYKFAMLIRLINEELERHNVENNLSFGGDDSFEEYPEFDFQFIKNTVNNQEAPFLSRILAYSLYITLFFSGLSLYQKSDRLETIFSYIKPYIIKPIQDGRVDLVADNLIDGDPVEIEKIPTAVFRSVPAYDGYVPDYALKSVVFFDGKCYPLEEIRRHLANS